MLPVSRVAKRLRLRTNDLQKHCAALSAAHTAAVPPGALSFVEVTIASTCRLPTPRTEIELQRADGARLRMHAHELPLPIIALVRMFLETA